MAALVSMACGRAGAPGRVHERVELAAEPALRADFEAKLMADDAMVSAYLGAESVALDGEVAVAGADRHMEAPLGSGAAYVFGPSGGAWQQITRLRQGDEHTDQHFGSSVAIFGDTIAVGAPHDSTVASNSGATYVYRRGGAGVWTQEQKVFGSEIGLVTNFGAALALRENTLFVGAYEPIHGKGSVYVFSRNASTWTELDRLTASDAATDDYFGRTLATDGTTLVVGAPLNDDSGDGSGSAYVFALEAGVWSEQQKLVAPMASTLELFGIAVAVDGNTLAVGAQGRKRGGVEFGAVFVFEKTGTAWELRAELSPAPLPQGAQFGRSLALRGDTLAVGAPLADAGPSTEVAGAVFVYRREGTSWGEPLQVTPPGGPFARQTFGSAIALGSSRLLVGAGQDREAAALAGAAYVFSLGQGGSGGQGGQGGQGGTSGQAGEAGESGTGGSSRGGGPGSGGSSSGAGGDGDAAGAGGEESGGSSGTGASGRGGAGVSGGSGGASGAGGTTTGSGGGNGGSAGRRGHNAVSGDDGGCGCRVGANTNRAGGAAGVLFALAAVLARRSRRRQLRSHP